MFSFGNSVSNTSTARNLHLPWLKNNILTTKLKMFFFILISKIEGPILCFWIRYIRIAWKMFDKSEHKNKYFHWLIIGKISLHIGKSPTKAIYWLQVWFGPYCKYRWWVLEWAALPQENFAIYTLI